MSNLLQWCSIIVILRVSSLKNLWGFVFSPFIQVLTRALDFASWSHSLQCLLSGPLRGSWLTPSQSERHWIPRERSGRAKPSSMTPSSWASVSNCSKTSLAKSQIQPLLLARNQGKNKRAGEKSFCTAEWERSLLPFTRHDLTGPA